MSQGITILDQTNHSSDQIGINYVIETSSIKFSTEGSLPTEEDDHEEVDDLLKQDTSDWDVFDDYEKFRLRELKLKEKRKREAQNERRHI